MALVLKPTSQMVVAFQGKVEAVKSHMVMVKINTSTITEKEQNKMAYECSKSRRI